MWARGRVHLGLAEGELGKLTLAQLSALSKAHNDLEKRADWRTAVLVCAIVNVNRGKDDPPLRPDVLMPWLRDDEAQEELKQSPEEMRAVLEEITRSMGGIVHPRHQPLSG